MRPNLRRFVPESWSFMIKPGDAYNHLIFNTYFLIIFSRLLIVGQAGQQLDAPQTKRRDIGSFLVSLSEKCRSLASIDFGILRIYGSNGDGWSARLQAAVDLSFEPNTLR